MRVAIADDSTLFRTGLAALLGGRGINVPSEAGEGTRLLTQLAQEPVDVAILDIRMPPTFTSEGLAIAERVRDEYPTVGILMLSTYAQADYATRLLQMSANRGDGMAGAGYLLKDRVADIHSLTDVLARLVQGESVID